MISGMISRDESYMRMALSLAEEGLGRVWPNPAVGCVIVNDGVVVGQGRTADGGRPHAEAEALAEAGAAAKGADVYVSLEPCSHHGKTPPCAEALVEAGVARVFVGCGDPDPRVAGQGIAILQDAGIEVVEGLCEDEALALNRGFFMRIEKGRPFVCLKQAVSADGMIAAGVGQRTQISGKDAHHYLHELRSTYDAIAVGVNTVIADDPLLTVRLKGHQHSIVRVVFDRDLRIPLDSQLVQTAKEEALWVVHYGAAERTRTRLEEAGVKLIQTGGCVRSALHALAAEGLTRLLVEGGAKLHHSFLEADLFDEVQLLKAPHELGAEGVRGALFPIDRLELEEMTGLGQDTLYIYRHCEEGSKQM